MPKPTDGVFVFTVAGAADLRLPFTAPHGGNVVMLVSPMVGEHGDTLLVQPSIVEQPDTHVVEQRLAFKMDRESLTLRLSVPALPKAGRYNGEISILKDGTVAQSVRLAITSTAGAIVVNAKTVTVYAKSSAFEQSPFRISLRSTAGPAVDGIYLRVLESTIPAGVSFDPQRNLSLCWNGQCAGNLWASPENKEPTRSIPPLQQISIDGELVDMPPGEYTIKVGFGAANAAIDPEQTVTLKIFVRDGWCLPFGVLFGAIMVSFFATKGLEVWRRRARLLQRIAELRTHWMTEEPAPMALVATRALLKQAEDRNRHWFKALLGPDLTTAQLDRAERLLKLLDRVRRTRAQIDSSGWRAMERFRAHKLLTSVAGSLNPSALDDAAMQAIEAKLTALDLWFDPMRHDELYKAAFDADIASLLNHALPEAFPDDYRNIAAELYAVLSGDRSKITPELEKAYAKLKVLCERNRNGDIDGLAAMAEAAKENTDLVAFLRAADMFSWSVLKDAEIEFIAPAKSDVDLPPAFALIQFQIAPKKAELGDNYLFKHNTEYGWVLELQKKSSFWTRLRGGAALEPKQVLATRRTNEPRLAQYAPAPGKLSVTVTRRFNGEAVPEKSDQPALTLSLDVQRSTEYSWTSALRFTDFMALVIATLFAVISGLGTYYLGKPAFGSITDYLALFTWGASVDQTKNFIQQLAAKAEN